MFLSCRYNSFIYLKLYYATQKYFQKFIKLAYHNFVEVLVLSLILHDINAVDKRPSWKTLQVNFASLFRVLFIGLTISIKILGTIPSLIMSIEFPFDDRVQVVIVRNIKSAKSWPKSILTVTVLPMVKLVTSVSSS